MAKRTDPSFWVSPEPPEDWEDLLRYIKPRTPEELHELFDVRPPAPPDPNEPPPMPEPGAERTLIEQLGLLPEEFVELALQQPDLWTKAELDYLYDVAQEGDFDERLDELAQSYFSGARQRKAGEGRPTPVVTPPVDASIEELPDLPGTTSIPDLETLEGTMNVDRWWEKQKS